MKVYTDISLQVELFGYSNDLKSASSIYGNNIYEWRKQKLFVKEVREKWSLIIIAEPS